MSLKNKNNERYEKCAKLKKELAKIQKEIKIWNGIDKIIDKNILKVKAEDYRKSQKGRDLRNSKNENKGKNEGEEIKVKPIEISKFSQI